MLLTRNCSVYSTLRHKILGNLVGFVIHLGCFFTLNLNFSSYAQPVPTGDQTTLEAQVEKALHPYLMTVDRRDARERISLTDQKLEIWRLESFERGDISHKLCEATRALIFGRLVRSLGIKQLFQDAPYLNVVELVFYRIKTEVNPDLNGQYQQTKSSQITARISISRERAQLLDLQVLKSTLKGTSCVSQARDLLDDLWISDETTARRERLRDAALELRARMNSPQK